MDLEFIKKRVKTYQSSAGKISGVPDEVLGEVLHAWEQWNGTAKKFGKALGITPRQAVILIEKAKERIRQGVELKPKADFQEIALSNGPPASSVQGPIMEVVWDNRRLIRFSQLQQLVDFMKAVA